MYWKAEGKDNGVQIFQVDAFTEKPFSGNPAAVCILPGPCSPTWMQNVAKEMNLSETAFLYKQEDGFHLRWFTPAAEVDYVVMPPWRVRTYCGRRVC